jgi:hypothetical protein
MSLFSWLSPRKKTPVPRTPESSGLSRMESTKPYSPRQGGASGEANGQPANRKGERMARRELLYVVVREAMMRAGVLSASYKFKVLSLDARGRQFLVMVDLIQGHGSDTSSLAEVEVMIAQQAKARYDIVVTAVYWRMADHVAVGQPAARAGGRVTPSQPAPPEPEPSSQPPVLEPAPSVSEPAPLQRAGGRYEPIQSDEMEAFRRALAAGASGPAALAAAGGAGARDFGGAPRQGPQSYTLLTGFEDTELAEGDAPAQALSATQYGELR